MKRVTESDYNSQAKVRHSINPLIQDARQEKTHSPPMGDFIDQNYQGTNQHVISQNFKLPRQGFPNLQQLQHVTKSQSPPLIMDAPGVKGNGALSSRPFLNGAGLQNNNHPQQNTEQQPYSFLNKHALQRQHPSSAKDLNAYLLSSYQHQQVVGQQKQQNPVPAMAAQQIKLAQQNAQQLYPLTQRTRGGGQNEIVMSGQDGCATVGHQSAVSSSQKTPAFYPNTSASLKEQCYDNVAPGGSFRNYEEEEDAKSPSLNLPSSLAADSSQAPSGSQGCRKRSLTKNHEKMLKSTNDNNKNKSMHLRQTTQLTGGVDTTRAIALSNRTLGHEFKQVHSDVLDSINQLQSLAQSSEHKVRDRKQEQPDQQAVTIDKRQLQTILSTLVNKVTQIGQIGQDWENMCDSINDSLSVSLGKSSTLNKRLKTMQKERNMSATKQRSQREKEMQKTKAVFERSLSAIRNTYERSYKTINNDYNQLEQMAQRMREFRVEIGDKRRQNVALLQQRSHETITKNKDPLVGAVNSTTAQPGAENVVDSDEGKEDQEMQYLFKGSELLKTFKLDPHLQPSIDQKATQSIQQHMESARRNHDVAPSATGQDVRVPHQRPQQSLRHQNQSSSQLKQTNSFFSNSNLRASGDEFELTNKFTDRQNHQNSNNNQNASSSAQQTTSQEFILNQMLNQQQSSNSNQNPNNYNFDENRTHQIPSIEQDRLPKNQLQDGGGAQDDRASYMKRPQQIQDHLQVIDDSLNSEPVTEQSAIHYQNTGNISKEIVYRSRNNAELQQVNQNTKANNQSISQCGDGGVEQQSQSRHPLQIGSNPTNSLDNSIAGISEIQAPAMMLQEVGGGWDSQYDIDNSMQMLEPAEMKQLQKAFREQYSAIEDRNQKILFRQFFALNNKINTSMLQSKVQSTYNSNVGGDTVKPNYQTALSTESQGNKILTENGKTNSREVKESRSIDFGLDKVSPVPKIMQNDPFRNSLAETAKRKMLQLHQKGDHPKSCASLQSSGAKRSAQGGRDVVLKDMLDVPDQFSLQSPLPPLTRDELQDGMSLTDDLTDEGDETNGFKRADDCYQLGDVQLADVLGAPSLEISLRTATELCESQAYDSNGASELVKPCLSVNKQASREAPKVLMRQSDKKAGASQNLLTEEAKNDGNLHHLPNRSQALIRQQVPQQHIGIQIVHEGTLNRNPAQLLQGTIYSDGRSSTVLSPHNNTLSQTVSNSNTLDLTKPNGRMSEVQENDYALELMSPQQVEEDSSLLISEETQANKRTQSSCRKSNMMLVSDTKSTHQESFLKKEAYNRNEPFSGQRKGTSSSLSGRKRRTNGSGHQKHLSAYQAENNAYVMGQVKKNLIFGSDTEQNVVEEQNPSTLTEQISAGSRNIKGMYQSSQKPKTQNLIPQENNFATSTSQNEGAKKAVTKTTFAMKQQEQLRKIALGQKPPALVAIQGCQQATSLTRVQEGGSTNYDSRQQIPNTTNTIKVMKPPQVKLLKKALIQRAQSQEPPGLPIKKQKSNNNCSLASIKTANISTKSGIKILNKRIQVLPQGGDGAALQNQKQVLTVNKVGKRVKLSTSVGAQARTKTNAANPSANESYVTTNSAGGSTSKGLVKVRMLSGAASAQFKNSVAKQVVGKQSLAAPKK